MKLIYDDNLYIYLFLLNFLIKVQIFDIDYLLDYLIKIQYHFFMQLVLNDLIIILLVFLYELMT
jgi:hypothetical protein